MKVKVEFTLDVEWCLMDHGTPKEGSALARLVQKSVAEAITNIVKLGQGNGFSHELETQLSILQDSDVIATLVQEK